MHSVVIALFLLLLLCLFGWWSVYRRMGRSGNASHPLYRVHQILLGLLSTLLMVLALLIVFSSDPGSGHEHLFWP